MDSRRASTQRGGQHSHNGTRRNSVAMSIEDPLSPVSSSGDSISEASVQFDREYPSKIGHHLERTSSTGAIGGVVSSTSLDRVRTNRSASTTATLNDPAFEVDFAADERANPKNFSFWYKLLIITVMSFCTTCVVLYSTSYTSAIPGLILDFGISNSTGILGVTTYLLGMAAGSVVLAPLSEMYGRRPIYIIAMGLFVITVLPCALAHNVTTILVCRFLGAFCASALISNAPGTVNDIVTEEYRALAFSIWSIGPMNGPVIGPVVGGFVYQYLGWRWTNWVVMIVSGVGWIIITFIEETYAPSILRKRAEKKRKETGDDRWWSRYDDKDPFWPLLKENLSRPFVLTITEPICIFWDVYIALVYGILYLCFVAYPIIFTEIRGWSPGYSGLAFSGIGVGSMIIICGEPLIRRIINSHKPDPATGEIPPEAMVSIVCVAAILIPVGEIWFSWTSLPPTHWIWPILAGIPFGMGNGGVFIYASNYLVHSYDIYAASALAGNAVLRSIMGATLPLAGPPLYNSLGAHWAGTLLGLLEVACIPIPFVFYRYGHKIRLKSRLISAMQEDKAKQQAKRAKAAERQKRRETGRSRKGSNVSGSDVEKAVIQEPNKS